MARAKTRVKICGIRDAETADVACNAGADALGFVFFDASPRAVSAGQVAEILPRLAPLVSSIGLFVDADAAYVRSVLKSCRLDCLQFHGRETPDYCESFGVPYIKAIPMRPDVDIDAEMAAHKGARAFLLDAWRPDTPGGTGETFDWTRVGTMDRPWLLAGGLNPENVGRAIALLAPDAVDVSGGVESRRGVKDTHLIESFMSAVSAADARRLAHSTHEDAVA